MERLLLMRQAEELRPLSLEKGVQLHVAGSCLVKVGRIADAVVDSHRPTGRLRRKQSPPVIVELALELLSDGNGPIDIATVVATERAKLRSSDGEPPRRRPRAGA